MDAMVQRPASDRDLDASIALAAVREQLPALECRHAEPLGAGWGTDVYLLDDRLAARFPRTAEAARWIVSDARNAGLREVDWDSGYAGPLRFVHGDFRDGNLIVDPASGRLVGVIDWGNAAVGDPALDFMTLVLWRGWEFTHRALGAYELPTDDQFLDRVRYHAQIQALQALTDSIRRRADTELHLSCLRNAFSLVPAS